MDYVPCNYIAQPGDVEKGVRMVPGGELGEYDYYVIKWLYEPIPMASTPKDEFATLDRWRGEQIRTILSGRCLIITTIPVVLPEIWEMII